MAGGGGGALVVPGAPDESRLFLVVSQDHAPFSFVATEPERTEPLGVLLSIAAAGDAVFIMILWVQPDRRREGVGSALLGALEDAARQAGVRRIWMLATAEARAFYTRHGYEERMDFLDDEAARYVQRVKNTPVFVKDLP